MTYAATVLADSPLGYWKLDETSGTTFADSSGSSRTASIVGTPTLGNTPATTSIGGHSAAFSGTGQYATISDPSAWMSNLTAVTFEAWVKFTATGVQQIMGIDPGVSSRVFQFRANAGQLQAIVFDDANGSHQFNCPGTQNDGTWHHFVATAANSGAICNVVLYVDGVSVATGSFTGGIQHSASASNPYFIAGRNTGSSDKWNGSLDELAVYGTALSSTRVATHYSTATGATTYTRSVALNAAATLSSARIATRRPAGALNATATLLASRVRGQRRSATLTAAATLSSRGSTAKLAAANLAATATLAATRVRSRIAAATLAALATLSPSTVRTRRRTAQLDAVATLSSTAPGGKRASATLNAVATLLSVPARPIVTPVAPPMQFGFQMLVPGSALIPVEAGLDFIEWGFVMLQPGDALIGDPA